MKSMGSFHKASLDKFTPKIYWNKFIRIFVRINLTTVRWNEPSFVLSAFISCVPESQGSSTKPCLCGVGAQTQGFMNVRYQLSYTPQIPS